MVMEMDWYATIAELTNSKIANKIDGKSLMPVILDNKKESPHEVVHWQFGDYDDEKAQWAVRKGPWKLIGNVNEPSGQGEKNNLDKLFLVNLDNDIGEKNNLAKSNPKKLNELLALHKAWIKSVSSEMNH
jgi:arylsulfatase A-like enzyme